MPTTDGLDRLLAGAVAACGPQAMCVLEPLLTYDSLHGGDLVHTLHVYLALGCNASRAAEALYLHRSGLLYRLGRIEELLGVRLDEFGSRVALELAVLSVAERSEKE